MLPYLTIAVCAIPLVQFLIIAFSRLTYAFDVEWMEGAILGHAVELLKTGSLYKPPSQDFIPFIYPPFYTYLTAAGVKLFGLSYTWGRLLSILSTLATAGLVGGIVWKELRNWVLAALAFLGLFAVYGSTGYWFDLVRIDSIVILLVAGSVFALLYITKRRGLNIIVCACLLALAVFGKQSFLVFAVALAAHLALARDWRGLGIFTISSLVIHGLLWGGLLVGEGRIAFTYILQVPRSHDWWEATAGQAIWEAFKNLFLFQPILTAISVPLLLSAWRLSPGEEKHHVQLFGLFAGAAVLITLLTRAKFGGFESAYIPTYLFLVLVSVHSMGLITGRLSESSDEAGTGGVSTAREGAVFWSLVLLLFLGYGAFNAMATDVSGQRVTRERRIAAHQLEAMVDAIDGRVMIPTRNTALVIREPEQNHYHTMAAGDLRSYPGLFETFKEDNERGFRSGKFQAIVMDVPVPSLQTLFGYRAVPLDSLGIHAEVLASMTGRPTCPKYLYYLPGVDVLTLKRAVAQASVPW